MEVIKIAFIPPKTGINVPCQLVNYNDKSRNTQITRNNTGQYTTRFLTKADIDETEVAYPVINVTCQSPANSGTVVNVLNPTATYQPKNKEGYNYLVSFQIETKNVVNSVTLPSVLLTLLGFTFNVTQFVDRPVVMLSCELHCWNQKYACECR
jgi:hypothetical protein